MKKIKSQQWWDMFNLEEEKIFLFIITRANNNSIITTSLQK